MAVAVAAATLACSANAAVMQAVFDFESVSGQPDPYYQDGFKFAPTQFVGGNCEPDASNPDRCLSDSSGNSGILTNMTKYGVDQNDTADDEAFTLTRFWFQLLGNGNQGNANNIFVEGFDENGNSVFLEEYNIGDTDSDVAGDLNPDGPIVKNNGDGYEVLFTTELASVFSVQWRSTDTAGIRLDGIEATYGMAPVPLPATALLLLGGVGGLGALRAARRKPS